MQNCFKKVSKSTKFKMLGALLMDMAGGPIKELSNTESNIIFLGTGQGSIVASKQLRGSGGIVLQVFGNQFLIDPGTGCLVRAGEFGINLRETTAILVSHNHIGHCNDVNAVIEAMTYGGLDRQGVLLGNETLINGTEKSRPYLTAYHRSLLEKVIVIKKDQRVGINDVEIQAMQANHTDEHGIGFKITTPEFILSYAGDTEYSGKLMDYYNDSDILILNVPNPGSEKIEGNLCRDDAVKIIEKVKPRLTIITHFSLKMINADPLNEAREMQKATGMQVIAAKDGLKINPRTYSAKRTQKSLKSY